MWLLKYKLCSAHSCLQHLAESCVHYSGVQIKEKADHPKTRELANPHKKFFRASESKYFSLILLVILLRIVGLFCLDWFFWVVGLCCLEFFDLDFFWRGVGWFIGVSWGVFGVEMQLM